MSAVFDIAVCVEQGADVDCLAAPEAALNGPIEGELEGAAVEGSVELELGCIACR